MNIPFEYTVGLIAIVSFVLTFIALPPLIRKLNNRGFKSQDMNKEHKPLVAKFGGIAVFLGFLVAFLLPLQLSPQQIAVNVLLVAALSISLIAFLGFADDVLSIPDIYRVLLPLFAALPLMLLKVGTDTMALPFIGTVNLDFGSIMLPFIGAVGLNMYVLILIPIGVVACSNLVNLLAGFNGLEAGQGIIISLFLIALLMLGGLDANKVTMVFLLIALIGALAAFMLFNWYPAKVFPGNIVTYLIGATVAVVVIVGNVERAGAILLAPQIIEFFLKALSKFKAENFGTCVNGKLTYKGATHSLTHLIMKAMKPTETQLVLVLYVLQIVAGMLAIASMRI